MTTLACKYNGIVNVDLATYTTTYPFDISGWTFSNCLYPMDLNVSVSAVPGADPPAGIAGHIFDYVGGTVRITAGTIAGGVDNRMGVGTVRYDEVGGTLAMYGLNQPNLSPDLYGTELPFNWGGTYAYGMGWGLLKSVAGVNTGCPAPYIGFGYDTTLGFLASDYDPGLVLNNDFWTAAGAFTSNPNSPHPNIPWSGTNFTNNGIIPYGGINWCQIYLNSATPGNSVMTTDFATGYTLYQPVLTNPTGFDVNGYVGNTLHIPSATFLGWLYLNSTTQTIDGITMNGFGILVRPDFSSYIILNFIPKDGTAATWASEIGTYNGKFDRNRFLFMANNNAPATIFVGSFPLDRQNLTRGALFQIPENRGFYR